MAVCLGGCNAYENHQFGVALGNGYYVRAFQIPTKQIVQLHYNHFGGDGVQTLNFLKTQVHMNWITYVSGFENFFHASEANDFDEAMDNVVFTDRCVMAHFDPNPFGDRYNWTWSYPGGDCRVGEGIGQ